MVLSCCLVVSIILDEPCEVRRTDIIISFVEEAARHKGFKRLAQRHAAHRHHISDSDFVPSCPAAPQT